MLLSDISSHFWTPGIEIYLGGLIILLLVLKYQFSQKKNLPPGPFGLPIVGYYPFLGKSPFVKLAELKKKYGGVFRLYLGSRMFLVISEVEALKIAYNKDAFHGRPPDSSFRLATKTVSFIEYSGIQWSEQKRFTLKVFRNLGFGRTRMEDVIKEEANFLLEEYEKSEKKANSVEDLLALSTTNIISVLLFGRRFNFEDPHRRVIDHYLEKISHFHSPVSLHTCFPWLRKILFGLGIRVGVNYSVANECVSELVSFNSKEIHCHEEEGVEESRDYIDSYLKETKNYQKADNIFSKGNLNGNIQLFLRAGSLTTRSVLEWSLLSCAAYPNIQKKLQEELDRVVGRERSPCWADHEQMPYTQAFLLEIQRWKTIVPINILRYTTSDTTLSGYDIPAGTIVLSNLWAIHNDPDHWKNPEKLMPERFLNEDGTKVRFNESFVSFSVGRRACPGQSLANVEMFLYLTTILQKNNCVLPPGDKPNFEGIAHITYQPKYFRVLFEPRK